MTVLAIVIACVAFVTVALTVALGASLLRSQQRAHARREDALVNQLLHLAGRSWQPAPADTWMPPVDPDATPGEWPVWAGAVEQEPVY